MDAFTAINLTLIFREIGDKIKARCHVNWGLTDLLPDKLAVLHVCVNPIKWPLVSM